MIDEPCTEQPWYDEIGCDKHADGVHRCKLGRNPHTLHRCECDAMVIEDQS